MDYLDLHIYKYTDVSDNKFFLVTETFQKPLNTYGYIPFNSFLPRHCKKAFIKGELICYVKNSSNLKAFEKMKALFWTRLRHRGYPPKFLQPIFELVQYSRRNFYLVPKFKNMQHRNRTLYFHTTYQSLIVKSRAKLSWEPTATVQEITEVCFQKPRLETGGFIIVWTYITFEQSEIHAKKIEHGTQPEASEPIVQRIQPRRQQRSKRKFEVGWCKVSGNRSNF